MSARVTVISPMFNVEEYVGTCIQSLLDQDYRDFEAIFVDDGSSDSTLAAARKAAGGDPRFTFLEQENAGQSAARNHALGIASGEFVMFLDSDDAYTPRTIGRLMEVRDAEDLDAVFFTAKMQYDDRDLIRTHYETHVDRVGEAKVIDGFQMMAHFHTSDSFRPSACMYLIRRSLLDDAGLRFREGIIHEDLLFTMQVFPLIGRCVFLSEPLYVRRMRPGSTMTKPRSLKNVHGLFTVTRELERILEQNCGGWPSAYLDAYCNRLYDTWDILAHDAMNLGEEQMERYRDDLAPADRAAFDLHVLEPGRYLAKTEELYTQSTTYKAGKAVMAVPIWLKERFQKAPE